jgi:hypothetical protein
MEIKTKFNYGDYVFIYRKNELQKYQITGITTKYFSPSVSSVEYRLWTGMEEIGVPEELCFANEDEVRADLEDQFEKLRNQESDEN